MSLNFRSFRVGALALAMGLIFTGSLWSQAKPKTGPEGAVRNFDARALEQGVFQRTPEPGQLRAVQDLERQVPGLSVRFDRATGATRSLSHPTQALTSTVPGDSAREAALGFVRNHLDALGLEAGDLAGFEVTDEVSSSVTGATHVYLRQSLDGIPVYNGQLHVNVDRDRRIVSVNNAFLPNLRGAVNTLKAAKGAEHAVASAAQHLGLDRRGLPRVLSVGSDARRTTEIDPTGISRDPIEAALMILPINRGLARLVWNFQIHTLDGQHVFDMNVDAASGKVWTRFDWVSDAQYRVYAEPDESPLHGTTARQLLVDPHDPGPSPLGWHDDGSTTYTITRGNNVYAFDDSDGNDRPPKGRTSDTECGASLNCDFAIDLNQEPASYIDAAVTNLFYWNNLIHDVQFLYGFDEAAGNFQNTNFSGQGAGGDAVDANAQDGSGNCNANFLTPTDGGTPRMQMFLCDITSPTRDGDLDNGVIVHEYGHGISIRQVGGPNNSSCLNNTQQPGEGWSDWFGLAYTAELGDAGTDSRGIGTYLFGQGPNGPGIRDLPYSTDPAVNDWTYESIAGASVPHGVGSRWAQAIWEVYWALVAEHGFDPDLSNSAAGAGNHRAMFYVNEGLKFTACGPSFLDTRDGVIQAAQNLFGGEDVCTVWGAFADFGLGVDASTAGAGTQSATNGFNVPPECCATPPPAPTLLSATDTGNNQVDLSWSSVTGAASYKVLRSTVSGGPYSEIATVAAPTTTFSDTSVNANTTYFYVIQAVASGNCASAFSNELSVTATGVECTTQVLYSNDFEGQSGLSDWGVGLFGGQNSSWQGIQSCSAASGSNIFRFGGNNCTGNYGNNNFTFAQPADATGISVPTGSRDTTLTFNHRREFESGFDGATLTVSLNGTNYFIVDGGAITGETYNGSIIGNSCEPAGSGGAPSFTGTSANFAGTQVDLDVVCDSITGGTSGCEGLTLFIGFTGITDCTVTGDGWFLDDVEVTTCTTQ